MEKTNKKKDERDMSDAEGKKKKKIPETGRIHRRKKDSDQHGKWAQNTQHSKPEPGLDERKGDTTRDN